MQKMHGVTVEKMIMFITSANCCKQLQSKLPGIPLCDFVIRDVGKMQQNIPIDSYMQIDCFFAIFQHIHFIDDLFANQLSIDSIEYWFYIDQSSTRVHYESSEKW